MKNPTKNNTKIYIIDNLTIEVIYKKMKNIRLSVRYPAGDIRVAVPMRTTESKIRSFVLSKIDWIKKHQDNFKKQPIPSPKIYANNESHDFQGKTYLLNVIEGKITPKIEIKDENYINLYVKPNTSIAKKVLLMQKWYRETMKNEMVKLIEKWEKIIGVKTNEYQIKKMKTKWGTCNIREKRIWLNLELIKRPIECLEMVLVHELVHLLERYHNDRFYGFMDKFLPDWKQTDKILNNLRIQID